MYININSLQKYQKLFNQVSTIEDEEPVLLTSRTVTQDGNEKKPEPKEEKQVSKYYIKYHIKYHIK